VWHDDVLHYVAAATGDYDGWRFVPRTWQRLTHGSSAYAMTAFTDRAGRRCVMSWLREEPQNDPSLVGHAGAHSVAALLTRTDSGRLALSPHPDLATLGEPIGFRPSSAGETRTALGARAAEISLAPTPGLRVQIADGAGTLVALTFGATELHVARRDRPDGVVPVIGRGEMRLLADADLLEVFGAGGYGAFRIGVATDPEATEIVITAPHPEFTLRIL
jgi:beta-fructofuranosidase